MSAVGKAGEHTLCTGHTFASTRLGNAAMCLFHPSPHFLIQFIFSLLCCIFYDRPLWDEAGYTSNKLTGFTWRPQPSLHDKCSREGPWRGQSPHGEQGSFSPQRGAWHLPQARK